MSRMTDRAPTPFRQRFWAQDYAEDLKRFLAKRRLIEADIKDVSQEVFLRLLRFERPAVVENPLAYILRVAANVSHDFRLRQARWEPLEAARPEMLEDERSVEQPTEDAFRARRVEDALARLPPVMRAVLALQSREDLTYAEIAVRLGITRRSVKRAIENGYAALRDSLARED